MRHKMFRLACPVSKSRQRRICSRGLMCVGLSTQAARHPLVADSTSPPFLPGSTVHSLLGCCLSRACVLWGDEGISQNILCQKGPTRSIKSKPQWRACMGIEPMMLVILAPCSDQMGVLGMPVIKGDHLLHLVLHLPLISRGDSRGMVKWLCSVGSCVSAAYSPASASDCPSYTPWCKKFPLKQLHLQQGAGSLEPVSTCSLLPPMAVWWIWFLLLLLCQSRQWLWRPFCVCSGLSVQCSEAFICSQTARGYSAPILNRLNSRTCAAGMIWGIKIAEYSTQDICV